MSFLRRVHQASRSNVYWQHSELAKRVEQLFGVQPIEVGTLKEHRQFKRRYKQEHPYLYAFMRGKYGVPGVQKVLQYPFLFCRNFMYSMRAGFLLKGHVLQGGEFGSLVEFDSLLFHGAFKKLEQYVEHQVPLSCFDCGARDKFFTPLRDPILGLKLLRENDEHEAADLYEWYQARKTRPSVHTLVKGLPKSVRYKKSNELREARYQEDTEKLVQLVKLRRTIWT